MRLALWQGYSPAADIDAACAQAEAALAAAAAMGAAALVLPEVWLPGYNRPDIPARAEILIAMAELEMARGKGVKIQSFADSSRSNASSSVKFA